MATCTLEFGEETVLLSKGGPPEAEFVLFDAGDIELASTGPGQVRETGYRTIADDAMRRLEAAGITVELAEEAAAATIPRIASTYARGAVARRVALLLGPAELFDGGVYDFGLRRYEGRWLDLPALALDLELARATTLMQSLSLVARLAELDPRTPVVLTTREYAATRRPGERSHKRIPIDHVFSLKGALQAHAARGRRTPGPEREVGASPEELVAGLTRRGATTHDPRARERITAIVAAMNVRAKPPRGPLSDPELWALEEQLSAGNPAGVIERVEALEKGGGRSPATSYLRARAALLGGRESPRVIAERTSGLAMSMASFAECTLLAAEAWTAAGEIKRAVPFARDLLLNKEAHEDVRARAERILEAAERDGIAPSAPPPPILEGLKIGDSVRPTPVSVPAARSSLHTDTPPLPFGINTFTPSDPPGSLPPILAIAPAPAPNMDNEPTRAVLSPASSQRERVAQVARSTSRPPPSKRPSPPFGLTAPSSGRVTPALTSRVDAPKRRSIAPPPSPETPHRKANWVPEDMMRGGSQPPFRSDSRGAHAYIPKAPKVAVTDEPEIAETLTMPPGLTGVAAPLETLPSSVIDARVQFTYLARDLAREYREERGVVLRIDLASIEAMQAYLFDRYTERRVRTVEEAVDVHRHGAMLSEILARTIDAFWVDIAPNDLGYWAMVVPPDTRVWPFGRILRLILMLHKERDLVSYFLELQARAE